MNKWQLFRERNCLKTQNFLWDCFSKVSLSFCLKSTNVESFFIVLSMFYFRVVDIIFLQIKILCFTKLLKYTDSSWWSFTTFLLVMCDVGTVVSTYRNLFISPFILPLTDLWHFQAFHFIISQCHHFCNFRFYPCCKQFFPRRIFSEVLTWPIVKWRIKSIDVLEWLPN